MKIQRRQQFILFIVCLSISLFFQNKNVNIFRKDLPEQFQSLKKKGLNKEVFKYIVKTSKFFSS